MAKAAGKKPAIETTRVRTEPPKKGKTGAQSRYLVEAHLIHGPMSEKYAGKDIYRVIEMLGSHTLEDLHAIIFEAFNREEEHLWEFRLGGKNFYDRKNLRFAPPECADESTADASEVTLDSLELKVGKRLFYLFDFGDDWMHEVDVVKIEPTEKKKGPPRIVKKIGRTPPQYRDDW